MLEEGLIELMHVMDCEQFLACNICTRTIGRQQNSVIKSTILLEFDCEGLNLRSHKY